MKCGGCSPKEDYPVSPAVLEKTECHPCYSQKAHHKFARMHLPVAPKCNISCNYCNRKFDCVNESRPGVTSEVLTPASAKIKFETVTAKLDNLSVVGIAGPGDALANWGKTRDTILHIQQSAPEIIFCLSTNGLMLPDYAEEIINLGIKHVTVTINCVDPQIGSKIYRFITYKGIKYTGEVGAKLLLERQLKGIELLTQNGVLVKINIVMIKDINDTHIPEVVKKVKELGVFMTNIMPLIPAPGSAFENYPQTSAVELNKMRDICEIDIKQMRHCKQCRADAIGLLGQDISAEFRTQQLQEEAAPLEKNKYKIAVATKGQRYIDEHFGYTSEFLIYESNDKGSKCLERRMVNKYCSGIEHCDQAEERKEKIVEMLSDCDAVLALRIGYHAKQRLIREGILPVEHCDSISNALRYTHEKLNAHVMQKEVI